MGCQPVHAPSGAGVSPTRTLMLTAVPAGVLAVHWMVLQATVAPASNTRDSNVPEAAYGDSRIQSTTILPPNTLKSLAAIGRIGPFTANPCVFTRTPSIE